MQINELTKQVYQNAMEHGWHDEERSFGDIVSLVHSELSEAIESYRDGWQFHEVYYESGKPCGIPIELADAIIRILDFCGRHEIDMEKALLIKHEYNKTRPYRHGGKVI